MSRALVWVDKCDWCQCDLGWFGGVRRIRLFAWWKHGDGPVTVKKSCRTTDLCDKCATAAHTAIEAVRRDALRPLNDKEG